MASNPIPRNVRRFKRLQREKGLKGVEARRAKREREFAEMRVVGGFVTFGCLGEHTVELLYGENYSTDFLAVSVDGEPRRPRSLRGVGRCVALMLWGKAREARSYREGNNDG